ncbi:MAG: helix-turn-helix domain-containing protein [Candidatus Bathyarchaeota archaeon]|nr:helix-turn-helix domain-containing protein [Candidatus Bathyarchaeum sp.]
MSEGKIRGKILVELWAAGKPMTIQDLAEKVGLNSSSAMGYLLGLIKAKYVSVPQKHYYTITNLGKQAIGLPKIDKNIAQNILGAVPFEKAFHFCSELDNYSGIHAASLSEFVDKIQTIDLKCIEFHLPRRDFENWIRSLGDLELSKKLGLLRASNLSGENMRNSLYQIVKSRCVELANLVA